MQELAQRGFSATQVNNALRGKTGSVRMQFRLHTVNTSNQFTEDITGIMLSGDVGQDWSQDIKRKLNLNVRDDEGREWQRVRVRPWCRLFLPPYGANDYVEWALGTFLVTGPARNADDTNLVTRALDCFDLTQQYVDDLFIVRTSFAAGTKYTTAISTLLGSVPKNIADSSKTLPAAKEWAPGDAKLTAINELLAAINYNPLHSDPMGTMLCEPYIDPNLRSEEYDYLDDEVSVVVPEMTQTIDQFSVPNRWVRVVSDPDRPYLTSVYTNNNPSSKTSYQARGRYIVDHELANDISDQATLDAYVKRIAQAASSIPETVDFTTGIMPIHSGNDCYRLRYGTLGIDGKYTEDSWSMPLSVGDGARMTHRAKRLVQV